jgi:hypothetical protein
VINEIKTTWIAAQRVFEKWRVKRPEWSTTDSPIKYVDPCRAYWETVYKYERLKFLIRTHKPEVLTVAELGSGACYLGALLGCDGLSWTGFDHPDREMYQDMASEFGLRVIDKDLNHDVPIEGRYDCIVATQISWMNDWTVEQFASWLELMRKSLNDGGLIMLWPNPQALQFNPEAMSLYAQHEIILPYLGRGYKL